MKLRHILLWALAAAVFSLSASSHAAKGIIKIGNGGGSPGSIVVSDSGFIDDVRSGDAIPFEQPLPVLNIGSTVTFDIVGPVGSRLATNVVKISDGTVITGHVNGNITIGSDQAVVVKNGGQINGNVSVNGGVLLVIEHSRVSGNIDVRDSGGLYIEESSVGRCVLHGPPVVGPVSIWSWTGSNSTSGRFTAIQSSLVRIMDSQIYGGIDVSSCDQFLLKDSASIGQVRIKDVRIVLSVDTTIRGGLDIHRGTAHFDDVFLIRGNTIYGNLTVDGLANTTDISGNTVTGVTRIGP